MTGASNRRKLLLRLALKGSYIVLQIEFDAIRNFLQHVNREAMDEIHSVLERNEAGAFEELDDFDNALFNPTSRQEIAARAVYYELTAIIERELQKSAHAPWLESSSPKHRGPKGLDWNNLTSESIRSVKIIQRVSFPDIQQLIEERYGIELRHLPGGEAFFEMRETVNAFKHRQGVIDFRKRPLESFRFPEYYQANVDRAYEFIDAAWTFIDALWQATDRRPPLSDAVEFKGLPQD
jgi:hypothetical protein